MKKNEKTQPVAVADTEPAAVAETTASTSTAEPEDDTPPTAPPADVAPEEKQPTANAEEKGAETPASTVPVVDQAVPEAKPAEEQPSIDLEAKLAEAEQRGYLRGRNENIADLMRQPGCLQRQSPRPDRPASAGLAGGPSADRNAEFTDSDSTAMILNNLRVSIWDK